MSIPGGFNSPGPVSTLRDMIGRTVGVTQSLPANLTPTPPPAQPPPFTATATAGTPGTIVPPAATAAQFDGGNITASPATAWVTGEYVETTSGAQRYWDGTDWQTGQAP